MVELTQPPFEVQCPDCALNAGRLISPASLSATQLMERVRPVSAVNWVRFVLHPQPHAWLIIDACAVSPLFSQATINAFSSPTYASFSQASPLRAEMRVGFVGKDFIFRLHDGHRLLIQAKKKGEIAGRRVIFLACQDWRVAGRGRDRPSRVCPRIHKVR
jgi:hypothetical protein